MLVKVSSAEEQTATLCLEYRKEVLHTHLSIHTSQVATLWCEEAHRAIEEVTLLTSEALQAKDIPISIVESYPTYSVIQAQEAVFIGTEE